MENTLNSIFDACAMGERFDIACASFSPDMGERFGTAPGSFAHRPRITSVISRGIATA